jgi:cytochrome c oxidase subunit 1
MVYAMLSIGLLGFIVWAHRYVYCRFGCRYTCLFYCSATMIIAVPTGIKVFSRLATLRGGFISHSKHRCYLFLVFFLLFTLGGLTGVVVQRWIRYCFTRYLLCCCTFSFMFHPWEQFLHYLQAFIFWFNKITGFTYSEFLGRLHFCGNFYWCFNITFFPMHFLGLAGMPFDVFQIIQIIMLL